MPKVSIIVPVFQAEQYLVRCIDSILHQTFRDFELILVDDGSKDRSGEICDRYAAQNSMIHVIHQENRGVSATRNAGLEWVLLNSDSEWIGFIDSDDWVAPMYLEALLGSAVQSGTDIAICRYENTNGEKLPEFDDWTASVREAGDLFLNDNVMSTVPWGKLIRRIYYKKIRFPEGKIYEDEYMMYRILFHARQAAVVDQPFYAYYQNSNGITKGEWSVKRLDILEALERQVSYLGRNGFHENAKYRFSTFVWVINNCLQDIESCRRLTKSEKKYHIKNMKKQLGFMLIKYGGRYLPFTNDNWNREAYITAFPLLRAAKTIWHGLKWILGKCGIVIHFK